MQTGVAFRLADFDWRDRIDWAGLVNTLLEIGAVLLLAWGSYRLLLVALRRMERTESVAGQGAGISAQEQRIATLVSLGRSVGLVVIAIISLFMILSAVGLQIGPLLAGAGVVGLAISFGAQSLVRDIISGLFILLENQFGVGDVIRVGDVSGQVERMTLRIVTMRDVQGVVHIVPNGEITSVSNLTRAFSRAMVEINVPYREDMDQVMDIMRAVGTELYGDPDWRPLMIDQPTVPGIESFGETSVTLRMLATTLPLKQWDVARELRRRLKRKLDEAHVEFPAPPRAFYMEEPATPNPSPGSAQSEQDLP